MMVSLLVLGVVAAAPEFCGSYTPSNSDGNIYRIDKANAALNVEAVAKALCDKPNDAARQALREGWANDIAKEWLISPQLVQSAIETRLDIGEFKKELNSFCKENARNADDPASAGIRYAWSCLAGCDAHDDMSFYADSVVEIGPVLTAGRLACHVPFALGLEKNEVNSKTPNEGDFEQPGRAIRAGSLLVDLERLDEQGYLGEVDGLKASPRVTQLLKENFYATRAWHQKVAAFYEKKSKNQAYKRIVFDAPRAAFNAWKGDAEKLVPLDVLVAAENAILTSSEALKSCADALRPGLPVLVKKSTGKTREELFSSIARIDWRFTVALARCEEEAGRAEAGSVLRGALVERGVPTRGPRFAAFAAAVLAYRDVVDSPKNPFAGKYSGSTFSLDGLDALRDRGAKAPSLDPDQGPIATLKPSGDWVEVTFSKVSWQEELRECEDMKPQRVSSYNVLTGEVQYARICKPAGFETRTAKAKPVRFPKAYSGGLKKGQWLEFSYGSDGKGMPVISYTDKKKANVETLFGLARK